MNSDSNITHTHTSAYQMLKLTLHPGLRGYEPKSCEASQLTILEDFV